MGEAGVNGGGFDGDDVSGVETDIFGPGGGSLMAGPGVTGWEGAQGPADISGPGGGSLVGGSQAGFAPGITGAGTPAPEGTVSPDGGGGAEPGELRQGPTLQKQKDQTREQIKEKRKRRRTLITGEEYGELGFAPVYRRSILGG